MQAEVYKNHTVFDTNQKTHVKTTVSITTLGNFYLIKNLRHDF